MNEDHGKAAYHRVMAQLEHDKQALQAYNGRQSKILIAIFAVLALLAFAVFERI